MEFYKLSIRRSSELGGEEITSLNFIGMPSKDSMKFAISNIELDNNDQFLWLETYNKDGELINQECIG